MPLFLQQIQTILKKLGKLIGVTALKYR